MSVVGIIPARLQSTRLPRKMLLAETGKPLIQYVWEQAIQARQLAEVVVATDSEEIYHVVKAFGGDCELTGDHPSGTDRIAEVARRRFPQAEALINIQGDEPELDPLLVDTAVETLLQNSCAHMSTLAAPLRNWSQVESSSCVKVVLDAGGKALYFSRSPIPHVRDVAPASVLPENSPWLLHVGIYGYRSDYLQKLTKMPVSRLESLEKLEQLRALENGASIQVAVVEHSSVGIDTPDDYARFVERQRAKS